MRMVTAIDDDPASEALSWLGHLLAWEDRLAALRDGGRDEAVDVATAPSAA